MRPLPALRPATDSDAEAIATLWHDGWADGHLGHVPAELAQHRTLPGFRRRVPPRIEQTTVAVMGERVAGFVMVREAEIEQLYVAAAARGTGVADALLRRGEQVIAAHGHDTAWLAVVAGNARARRFYARNGWHDAAGIDYAAEVESGTLPVPCRRYEKPTATTKRGPNAPPR